MAQHEPDGSGDRPRPGAGCFLTGGTIVFGIFLIGAVVQVVTADPNNPGAFTGALFGTGFVGLFFVGFLLFFLAARRRG